jgi:hypothetical protein
MNFQPAPSALEQFCARLSGVSAVELQVLLERLLGLSGTVAAQLIQCLVDAGVQFGTDRG